MNAVQRFKRVHPFIPLLLSLIWLSIPTLAQNECSGTGNSALIPLTVADSNGVVHQNGCTDSGGRIVWQFGRTTPGMVAQFDATLQSANITSFPFYAVPANQGGTYRGCAYSVVTRAATTSSTLATTNMAYTDQDTNFTGGPFGWGNGATNNTVGTNSVNNTSAASCQAFQVKGGTTINLLTNGYVSVGGTSMQYAFHFKLEYLGP